MSESLPDDVLAYFRHWGGDYNYDKPVTSTAKELLAKYAPPALKAGDVLTANSPEPPIGSVVQAHGTVWMRDCDAWRPADSYEWDLDGWEFVSSSMSVVVIHVGVTT